MLKSIWFDCICVIHLCVDVCMHVFFLLCCAERMLGSTCLSLSPLCSLRVASRQGWTRCEGRGTTVWWRGSTGIAVASTRRTAGPSTSTDGRYPSTVFRPSRLPGRACRLLPALLCFWSLDCLSSRPSRVTWRHGAQLGCRWVASGSQFSSLSVVSLRSSNCLKFPH